MKNMASNRRVLTLLLFLLAFLFGAFVRVMPVMQAGFPLNDGGLFYSMTSDLQNAHYALPAETTYNHLGIPYAYPPLPFYLTALVRSITGADLLEIIRWLPVFFSLLTIPALFLLAQALLGDPLQAALATVIYALLPRSYEWVIMGGGVTRAPAALFLVLMTWGLYRLFQSGGWKYYLVSIICGALVILTHPERSLHAVATAAILFFYFGRSRTDLKRAVIVAFGVLVLTSPWWIFALTRYGWAPFSLAFQSSGQRWLFWSPLLLLNFTDESIALVALLAVVGVLACLLQRKTFLPFWLALAFLVDPRSAPHVIAVQTSLLAALGLSDVIFPALGRLGKPALNTEDETLFLTKKRGRWVFGYILLMLLVNSMLNLQTLGKLVLSNADRTAMHWIANATPAGSRFLALSWRNDSSVTPLLEWFPALSGRTNISTIQGREWLPGSQNYSARQAAFPKLYACLFQNTACLEHWASSQSDTFNYVYLSLTNAAGDFPQPSLLEDSLLESDRYQVVYQTATVLIFSRR
jgi:hypothetical protein